LIVRINDIEKPETDVPHRTGFVARLLAETGGQEPEEYIKSAEGVFEGIYVNFSARPSSVLGFGKGSVLEVTSLCSEAGGYREVAAKPNLAFAKHWQRKQSISCRFPEEVKESMQANPCRMFKL
jgi:hypothetical protein